MIDTLIIYALSCYMVYYVVGQSDLLAAPRAWVSRKLPGWLTYPLSCSLCFSFWLTLVFGLLGVVSIDALTLLAAPVVNLVLDMVVKRLANQPNEQKNKAILDLCASWGGNSQWRDAVTKEAIAALRAGEMAANGDGVKIPESDPWWKTLGGTKPPFYGWKLAPLPLPLPEGWEASNMHGYVCPTLHGRRVRTTYFNGQVGIIEDGCRNGDDCSGTFGDLLYRLRSEDGKPIGHVPIKTCTFLD